MMQWGIMQWPTFNYMVATLRYILPQQSKEHQMYRHEQYQHVWCYPHLVAILSMLTSAILLEELLVQSMKLNIYKQMILKTQLMLFDWRIQTTRHGHSGSQSGFGFIHSGFGFLGLSKSTPFGLYKSLVRDRFGFYRVRVGVSKFSKNRYNPLYFRVRVPIGSSV